VKDVTRSRSAKVAEEAATHMGGDYYCDDSGASRTVGSAAAGGGFSAASAAVFVQRGADPLVLPTNRLKDGKDEGLVTSCATPIVVALDVTASRGDDAKILYDKLPMFYGSIMTNACACDAEHTHRSPQPEPLQCLTRPCVRVAVVWTRRRGPTDIVRCDRRRTV